MLKKIDKNFKILEKASYILFDPTLWYAAHDFFESHNIDYYLIGLDYFGNSEITPTLIDLTKVSSDFKNKLWENIGENTTTSGFSLVDQMSQLQNIFYTKINIYEMIDYVKKIMILNSKENKIFRFYDPRVSIYLDGLDFKDLNKKQELEFFYQVLDGWVISIADNYYELDLKYLIKNNGLNFKINQMLLISDLKELFIEGSGLDFISELNKQKNIEMVKI